MINKKESEIMKKWDETYKKPLVSVCCITYNHEKFIEKTLDSIFMQDTTFPFEVLIYDDASIDKTQEKIMEYKRRFPNILFPIIGKKNQYSRGLRVINPKFNFHRARGEYLALCDGDDYWTDPLKLQLQIDEMKKFPEINISFHPAFVLTNEEKNRVMSRYGEEKKIFDVCSVIKGDGNFMPTSSLVIRRNIVDILPDWFYTETPVGDFFIQVISTYPNGAIYIPKVMSCYRINSKGWSNKIKTSLKLRSSFFDKMMRSLDLLNEFTSNKCRKEILFIKNKHRILYLFYLEDELRSRNTANNRDCIIRKIVEVKNQLNFFYKIVYKIFFFSRYFGFIDFIVKKISKIILKYLSFTIGIGKIQSLFITYFR